MQKKSALFLGLAIVVLVILINGCSQLREAPLTVNITAIDSTPLEVDILADDTDGDGQVSGYHAEEITVKLKTSSLGDDSGNLLNNSSAPGIYLTSYTVDYTLLNVANTLTSYSGGTSIYLKGNESGEFPLRAVTFDQKDWVRDTYGSSADVNAKATITLSGKDDFENPVSVIGSFDIIFANFAETTS